MFDRLRRGLGIGLTVCLLAGLPVALPKFARAQTGRVNRALLIGVDDFVSRDSTYPASTNNVFAMQEALQGSSEPFDTIMIPDAPVVTVEMLTRLIRETFESALQMGREAVSSVGADDNQADDVIDELRRRDAERFTLEVAGGPFAGRALVLGNIDYIEPPKHDDEPESKPN